MKSKHILIIVLLSFVLFSCTQGSSDSSLFLLAVMNKDSSSQSDNKPEQPGNDVSPDKSDDTIPEISGDDENNNPEESDKKDDNNPTKPQKTSLVNQFFWGTWICMADGTEFDIDEKDLISKKINYSVSTLSDSEIVVNSLGKFQKQSESVILNNGIPYFRKGGTNLSYSLKLVGFENELSRASSASSLGGFLAIGTSNSFSSFKSETTSAEDGTINLTAPIRGDVQTVSIKTEDNLIVVPGINILNSGEYVGTVPVVSSGNYILKVSGEIADFEKNDGYLYGNNYKSYPMTLNISNISEVSSFASLCKIYSSDSNLKITSDENVAEGISISTLKPGLTKTILINVEYETLLDGYVDTGINIEITNGKTHQKWIDYVPLRFYKGMIPITIAAKSPEYNNKSTLNGFIVYPDGNNQFFRISEDSSETIYVPTFKKDDKYLLSFSGATVEGALSDSTEMFYTVNVANKDVKEVVITGDMTLDAYSYGEPNESEDTVFEADLSFEAYISEGEIDYFKLPVNLENVVSPNMADYVNVRFVTDHDVVPQTKVLPIGEIINDLPVLSAEGYIFDGWYLENKKVESLVVNTNTILVAKWTPIQYEIIYVLNGGYGEQLNPYVYTIEDSFVLNEPVRAGYNFGGWFKTSDFKDELFEIATGTTGVIMLYAKWIAKTNVRYYVKHYQQNIENNNYSLYETEELFGTTDNETNAVARDFVGFTTIAYEQKMIDGNESTVVNIYYARKIITFTFDLDGGKAEYISGTNKISKKYGTKVSIENPVKENYKFIGWNTIGGTLPEYFYEDSEFTSKWSGSSISVTVSQLSDINVNVETNEDSIIFTADEGYDLYMWTVDEEVQNEDTNCFILDRTKLTTGVYEIVLLAKNKIGYRSATIFVKE